MKKTALALSLTIATLLIFFSCNTATENADNTGKIENTFQSVSYFSDAANLAPRPSKKH